jgi:hypothetical protein
LLGVMAEVRVGYFGGGDGRLELLGVMAAAGGDDFLAGVVSGAIFGIGQLPSAPQPKPLKAAIIMTAPL